MSETKVGTLHEFKGHWSVLTARVKRGGVYYRTLCPLETGSPFKVSSLTAWVEFKMSSDATNCLGSVWSWDDGTVGVIEDARETQGGWSRRVFRLSIVGEPLKHVGSIPGKSGGLSAAQALLKGSTPHTFKSYGDHRVILNGTPTDKVAFLIHGNNQTATSWIPGEADAQDGKVAFCKELLDLGYDIVALKSPDAAFATADLEEMAFLIELCDTFLSRLTPKNEVLAMGFSAGCGPAQLIASAFQPRVRKAGVTVFNARGSIRAFAEADHLWCFWALASNDRIADANEIKAQIQSVRSLTNGVVELHEKELSGSTHRVGEEFLPLWRVWHTNWQSS